MFVFEEIFKEQRSILSQELDLRLQRALSWFKRASQIHQEQEVKLLYNWIALNALYVQDIELHFSQRLQQLSHFLTAMTTLDTERKIVQSLTSKLDWAMQTFLESPYLSYHFWKFQHQELSETQWQQQRLDEKNQLTKAMHESRYADILNFMFARIAMLHMQMSLGGMMNQSQIFRQLTDSACQILTVLLPVFMQIMLEHAQNFSDQSRFFPVVQFS